MALIEEELGQPWPNIYSELTSSPIAAGKNHDKYLNVQEAFSLGFLSTTCSF